MKKKKRILAKITINDYIKAVKKADREIQQSNQPGWISTNRIHTNKKLYNRKVDKKDYSEE